MVTLLNDIRLQLGKAPLGFLNTLLYTLAEEHPEAFNNIDSSNYDNKCTVPVFQRDQECCPYGFKGTSNSWNPLTGMNTETFSYFLGLGSPKFEVLANLVKDI